MNQPSSLIVVKIGGSTLGAHDTTLEDLLYLQREAGITPVVVHGGGQAITQWDALRGVETKFVRGLRVTTIEGLQTVMAVLAGLINKQLVTALQTLGAKAVGISGLDGALLQADFADPELGFVGKVVGVNPEPVYTLLEAGFIPVIAPLGVRLPSRKGEEAIPLNLNGDTAAGELAAALGAGRLIFLTDVEGVLDKQGKVILRLTPEEIKAAIASGVIAGGMIPKVEAAVRALDGGGAAQIVDGRSRHALRAAIEGELSGTLIVPGP